MKASTLRAMTDRLVGAFERMQYSAGFISDRENQELSDRLHYVNELIEDLEELKFVAIGISKSIEQEIQVLEMENEE